MIISELRERFARPPAEFGPTPFWFLNDELDEERLCSALEEMKSKGIAGVIIHPRTGMEVEYLSEAFWEKMCFICETLRRLRMQGWIYDEYNWPSGPVGGRLLREHPEFKQVGLDYRLCGPSEVKRSLAELPGKLFAGFAVNRNGISDKTEEVENGLTDVFRGDRALVFFLKEVRVRMYSTHCAPWAKGEPGYLDLLNPDAVDEFMKLTHLEYDRHLKDFYGSPLVGIFTDEPQNYGALPYTHSLPAAFRERFGRDILESLPSLAGRFPGIPIADHIRNRTNYFEIARDLYVQSYFAKISEWASERGLIFTGHLCEEDDIGRLPSTNVSFYAPLSRMDMPGTDVLSDKHGYDKQHGTMVHPNFNPKALSSTAHHSGARRTLCEIWGGNGWATPPEKLKAVLNWAQAAGVNFVCPHAVYMSLRGLRKRDFPSSHFPPQPWWRFYEKVSEYIARLSFLNSQGVHTADVLFAFPMKSLWAGFDLKKRSDRLADLIEAATESLLRNQLDFDYLFDEVLDSGTVAIEEGQLVVGEEKYSVLLFPMASVISGELLNIAEQFAAAGGPVVAFGYETPEHDEYGEEISDRVGALLDAENKTVVHRRLGKDLRSDLNWIVENIRGHTRPDLHVTGELARNMIYLHRTIEGTNVYFIANLSEDEGIAQLAFRCKGRPQTWDPENGSIKNVLAYKDGLEYSHIRARFHPNQALFYVFTEEPPVDRVDSTNLNLTFVSPEFAEGYTSALEVRLSRAGKRYTRSVEQALPPIFLPERWEIDYPLRNIMLLDEWEIEILEGGETPEWDPSDEPLLGVRARMLVAAMGGALAFGRILKKSFGKARARTTRYEPMDAMADTGDKWCRLLGIDRHRLEQYEEAELLLRMAAHIQFGMGYNYPPAGSTYAMHTVFHADHIPDDLSIVYENLEGGPISIQLNGTEIDRAGESVFIWDASNRAVPIAQHLKKGENRLRMEWRQPSFPSLFPSVHGIEPVCLAGTFWVKSGRVVEQKYRAPAMPWSQIGLPDYIGPLTYKSSFEMPTSYMAQQLFLKFDRIGAAAEVKINDKPAGVILWRPYVLDITNLLVQGENSIEVTVANTAANLLGESVPAGIIGKPYIVPYWRHRIRLSN